MSLDFFKMVALPELGSTFWITAVFTVTLIGISKAGFGSGPGVIATPLLSLVMPVAAAAALLLPILLMVDVFVVHQYRREVDAPNLRRLLPGALVGIVLGGLFFYQFSSNERVLKVSIGVLAVGFVLYQLMRGRLTRPRPASRWDSTSPAGVLVGAFSGFISTLAHVGGPPIVIYLLPQQLPRRLFVGTTAVFFFIVNLIKLIPYALLGLLVVGNLWMTLLLLPVAVVGVRIGVWLNGRFTDTWFNRVVYVILLLVGIQLILGQSLIGIVLN
ncbi:MAG: sulfite exporter TauE/SafE family protein [Anaerolineales bacterium]|nr:sulfite exporter TauE/SafE family protein [Anaerolineales bacterium]